MMQYKKGPSIIDIKPNNNAVGVPVDIVISIKFDTEVAKSSIANNVHLYDRFGKEVDTRLSYADKTITVTPRQPLSGNHGYRVVVHGDNDPENIGGHKGICDPLGYHMLGDYDFVFTTFSQAKAVETVINGSPHNIIITSQPIIKFDVTDKTGNPVDIVEVQLSTTNTFESNVWSGTIDYTPTLKSDGFVPDVELEDGLYYWRARVKGQTIDGNWSSIFSFNINSVPQFPIVEDDAIAMDPAFPDTWDMLDPEVIEVYPKDKFSNVSTNLKTISIVVDQIIPAEQITSDMLTLIGEPVDEDGIRPRHGLVEGQLDVAYDRLAGTTTIIYTLPVLGGDE